MFHTCHSQTLGVSLKHCVLHPHPLPVKAVPILPFRVIVMAEMCSATSSGVMVVSKIVTVIIITCSAGTQTQGFPHAVQRLPLSHTPWYYHVHKHLLCAEH